MSDQQKRAVVMGATSGIGMEVAKLLAADGWQVAIAGRRVELLRQVADTSVNIVAIGQIDVTDSDAPSRLQRLISELGGMQLYFHSSGIGWQNEALDGEKEVATVATNTVGFTRMVDAAFNYFASKGERGHIACITSIAGTRGLGAAPAYSASKRFQSHYIECLSQLARIRRLPIAFTDVRPGFVATNLIAGAAYPMQLSAADVARSIVKAIGRGKNVVTIDWRYRLLVALWRLVPRWIWVRIPVSTNHR